MGKSIHMRHTFLLQLAINVLNILNLFCTLIIMIDLFDVFCPDFQWLVVPEIQDRSHLWDDRKWHTVQWQWTLGQHNIQWALVVGRDREKDWSTDICRFMMQSCLNCKLADARSCMTGICDGVDKKWKDNYAHQTHMVQGYRSKWACQTT